MPKSDFGVSWAAGGVVDIYDDDDDDAAGDVTANKEIEINTYYQMGEWTTIDGNKRHITINVTLIAGTTYKAKERISVKVEDEGTTLVIRCRMPDILNEPGLDTWFSDVPDSERDNDFHHEVCVMSDVLKHQKESTGTKDVTGVMRIALKFACDTKFKLRNKADDHGARALYILLTEVETIVMTENNPDEDWPVCGRLKSNQRIGSRLCLCQLPEGGWVVIRYRHV